MTNEQPSTTQPPQAQKKRDASRRPSQPRTNTIRPPESPYPYRQPARPAHLDSAPRRQVRRKPPPPDTHSHTQLGTARSPRPAARPGNPGPPPPADPAP